MMQTENKNLNLPSHMDSISRQNGSGDPEQAEISMLPSHSSNINNCRLEVKDPKGNGDM